ncbi:MAG: hypothetical protein M1819_003521 [Sarea resinae]|nr:MAG: hypothetical protein M1819_003521 [Sarea resinae]
MAPITLKTRPFRRFITNVAAVPARRLSLHLSSRSQPEDSSSLSSHLLGKRQNIVAIPATYAGLNAGPTPGTVVGIILGSVAGFLFLVWLLSLAFNARGSNVSVDQVETISRRSPRTRSTRSRRQDMTEVRTASRVSRSPRPRSERTERIIIEDRREPPPAPAPPPPEPRDEVIEVIEEAETPPPPRRVRSHRRDSGFRPVDPDMYAGGDMPMEDVYGHGRRSSGRRR